MQHLSEIHEMELLNAIIEHYDNGTLPQVMPLLRDEIESLTDGSIERGERYEYSIRTA